MHGYLRLQFWIVSRGAQDSVFNAGVQEVRSGRYRQALPVHDKRPAMVGSEGCQDLTDISGITAAKPVRVVGQAKLSKVGRQLRLKRQATFLEHAPEDLIENIRADRSDINLVRHPPQKGFIGQLRGLQVGRECQRQLKGNLERHAVFERQVVDTPVER